MVHSFHFFRKCQEPCWNRFIYTDLELNLIETIKRTVYSTKQNQTTQLHYETIICQREKYRSRDYTFKPKMFVFMALSIFHIFAWYGGLFCLVSRNVSATFVDYTIYFENTQTQHSKSAAAAAIIWTLNVAKYQKYLPKEFNIQKSAAAATEFEMFKFARYHYSFDNKIRKSFECCQLSIFLQYQN